MTTKQKICGIFESWKPVILENCNQPILQKRLLVLFSVQTAHRIDFSSHQFNELGSRQKYFIKRIENQKLLKLARVCSIFNNDFFQSHTVSLNMNFCKTLVHNACQFCITSLYVTEVFPDDFKSFIENFSCLTFEYCVDIFKVFFDNFCKISRGFKVICKM